MRAPKRALSLLAIGLALTLAFFIVPAVTDSGQHASADAPFRLIYYDGHMHTNRSDGEGSVKEIAATAEQRGLDVVIITDHCKDLTLAEWQSLVAETAEVSELGGVLALPAFEITGREGMLNRGHMNAYNAPDPFVGDDSLEQCPEEVWPDSDPNGNPYGTGVQYPENLAKWASWVHSQGGIVNHNHTSGTTQLSYGVNNIEIYNQGHVDDITNAALALGIPPADALGLGLSANNFAIYGETEPAPYKGLNDQVEFPDVGDVTLRWGLWAGTGMLSDSGIGQIVGWGSFNPYNPSSPGDGDLNSWDDLLMAYVDGTAKRPTFGVANSDAHNTGDLCYWNEDGSYQADGEGTCCNDEEDDPTADGVDGEDPQCIDAIDKYEAWDASGIGVARNGLYVKAVTPSEVYKAIKAGRSFATTGPSIAFDINGKQMGSTAGIPSGGKANLNLRLKAETPGYILYQIRIVENGVAWPTIMPFSPTYQKSLSDTVTADGYYRIEITSVPAPGVPGLPQFAYSNPVFVDVP